MENGWQIRPLLAPKFLFGPVIMIFRLRSKLAKQTCPVAETYSGPKDIVSLPNIPSRTKYFGVEYLRVRISMNFVNELFVCE